MKKLYPFIFLILLSLAIFLTTQIVKAPVKDGLEVSFLNIGQGDSELIKKGDFEILIDGGPDDKVLSEIGKIMSSTDHKIEIMILTHPHADHITGLNAILDRYEVGEVYSSGTIFNSSGYLEFLQKLKDKNIQLIVPSIGSSQIFADNATLTFLWPGNKFVNKKADNPNNTSLISKVCYFQECAIFMGDQEVDEQESMISYYKNIGKTDVLKSEIIKVAHHGSSTGLLPELYEAVAPKTAVIEVGKDNQFGHPHQQVLDYLNQNSIKIYRTDQDGTVNFLFT